MEKLYYQNIHWYDFLIYIAYNLILSFLILRISDAGFNIGKRGSRMLLLQFQLFFALLMLDIQFDFLPAVADGNIFASVVETGQYPTGLDENILPYYYLSILINMVSLSSAIVFMIISFFVFCVAQLFFIASLRKLNGSDNAKGVNLFILLNLIFPALYLFLPSPSREAYTLLAFSVFIFSLVKWRSSGKIIAACIWGVVLSLLSFKFIPFVLITFIAMLIMNQDFRRQLYSVAIILISVVVGLLILHSQGIDAAWFADKRNQTLFDTGNYVYGRVDWHNYLQMLGDQFLLAGQFLLSPLPVFSGYDFWTKVPWITEGLFIALLLLFFIAVLKRSIRQSGWLIVLLLIFLFYFGSIDNDLENAMRQRIPAIELIFVLIAGVFRQQKPAV